MSTTTAWTKSSQQKGSGSVGGAPSSKAHAIPPNLGKQKSASVDGVEAVEQEIKRVLGGTGVTLEKIGQSFAVISDLTTRRLSGRLDLQNEDGVGFKLPNLTVAIDQVVETFRGDFPAARAVLQRNNLASSSDLFFHEIGELELMDEVRTDDQAPEHEKQRKTVAAEHAKHLEALMRDHPTLFPMTPRPQGKLSAYATWRKDRAMR
ncbi:hypothetical protein C8F01DRAFT_1076817 [Mycena amicta]|nr:hypothetical protein C8F01DRAFT_1076817 [Mycena amicta]